MPTWFKLSLVALFGFFWIIPISVSVPFIYRNAYLLTFLLAFIFLYLYFCLFLISQHRLAETKRNDFYQRMSVKKVAILLLSVLWISLLTGDVVRLLTPITADILASKFAIHEYKSVKIEPYAKKFRHLSKLYVVDINNNEASFVIKDEMLNQLKIRSGDKLLVHGRDCIAGFVIDNINGIERK
jgi:hypothetical protein